MGSINSSNKSNSPHECNVNYDKANIISINTAKIAIIPAMSNTVTKKMLHYSLDNCSAIYCSIIIIKITMDAIIISSSFMIMIRNCYLIVKRADGISIHLSF